MSDIKFSKLIAYGFAFLLASGILVACVNTESRESLKENNNESAETIIKTGASTELDSAQTDNKEVITETSGDDKTE